MTQIIQLIKRIYQRIKLIVVTTHRITFKFQQQKENPHLFTHTFSM